MLDVMLTWDQTGSYEVGELRGAARKPERRRLDDDAAADEGVPQDSAGEHPGDLHAHAARRLQPGDVVIKQGDEGDYFYVIVKGRCVVTRETPLNKEGIKLAELGIGDTFGEEALISERSATPP